MSPRAPAHRRLELRSLTIAPEYGDEATSKIPGYYGDDGVRWGVAFREGDSVSSESFKTYNEALLFAVSKLEDWHRRITKP